VALPLRCRLTAAAGGSHACSWTARASSPARRVIHGADGRVHVTETWQRERIRHVALTPEEL